VAANEPADAGFAETGWVPISRSLLAGRQGALAFEVLVTPVTPVALVAPETPEALVAPETGLVGPGAGA
jgi:hypothetical protein